MPQYKTMIDLFGEAVELRASSFMSEGIPVSCIFSNGKAIPDVALIRPYDGLVQYDEEKMFAAVEDVRSRQSTGFNMFFLVARPILFVFEMFIALLRGIGGFFSQHAVLGFFSMGFALITIAVIVMTLGAMAMAFLYAAPFLLLVFLIRWTYRSGSQDAVEALKKGAMLLSEIIANAEAGDVVEVGGASGDGMVIEGSVDHVSELNSRPSAEQRLLACSGGSNTSGGQFGGGLKIWLAIGAPVVLAAFIYGPMIFRSSPAPIAPVASLQPQIQKPAPVVPAAAIPPVKQVPAAAIPPARQIPISHSGIPEILDTATLSVNGQRLPLAGLRPVEMPQAAAAARSYLEQAGGVTCEQALVGGWRCVSQSKGLDIAEVFALSGFAKAAANAPDFIRNAEGMARENRRGVWGAS